MPNKTLLQKSTITTLASRKPSLWTNLLDIVFEAKHFFASLLAKPSNMLLLNRRRNLNKAIRRHIFRSNLGANFEMLEGRRLMAVVYSDDFNRASLATPALYTVTNNVGNGTAAIVSSTTLQLSTAASSGVAGWTSVATTPTVSNGWATTLDNATGVVTWTFNMRYARTGNTPSGFSSGSYGNGFVLNSDNNDFAAAGAKGYAVMFGNTSSPDTFRLVAFNNGIKADYTTVGAAAGNALIVGAALTPFSVTTQTQSNNFYSFKVTFDPSSKVWSMFGRDDGASAFSDPAAGTFTTIGSFTETTAIYRGTALGKLGALWSYSTAAGNNSQFDNFKLDVTASPSISSSGTLAAVGTTYGTATPSPSSFSISGANMAAGITVTPPAGFEVSTQNDFSSSVGTNSTPITVGSSGTIGNTTIYVRLPATANAGTYSGNIVLSSSGATSRNVATASSIVSKKGLSINGLSVVTKNYDNLTTATLNGTPAYVGLENGQSFSVSGTPTANFIDANAGPSKAVTVTGYTAPSANYSVTQPALTGEISKVSLEITANNAQKVQGTSLSSPVVGSTAFTITNSTTVAGQTIGSVKITYGAGKDIGDAAGNYAGSVVASDATGGTFNPLNYSINYVAGDLLVTANPTITTSGSLADVSTTYGTPSISPASFTVNAGFLTAGDLTVTAPAGFEVSKLVGSGYSTGLTLAQTSGSVANTTIFVRLAATTAAGTYSGNVTIAGGGATTVNVATVPSTVAKKALAILGLTASNKPYDTTIAASVGGVPTYSGLENGESFPSLSVGTWNYSNKVVGANKSLSRTTAFAAPSVNYTVTQPSLSADITAVTLTVSGAAVTTKQYDTTNAATITGSLSGVLIGDTVNFASNAGTFASANAGTGISVTANLTLGDVDAPNYILTQPTGLFGDITKANQTITFNTLPAKTTADAPFALTATSSSGLSIQYQSSSTSVASISGSTVTIVGIGTTTITASQDGDSNYNPATAVPQLLTVSAPPTVLGAGDIAIIGYNSTGSPDSFTILVLKDLSPGTVFFASDNEVTTTPFNSFADLSEGEASFTVKAGQTILAGTVITLPWGGAAVNNAKYDWSSTSTFGLNNGPSDEVFLYTATDIASTTPTAFIFGVKLGGTTLKPAALTNGSTFVTLTTATSRYKTSGVLYTGSQSGLLTSIGNTSNWEALAPAGTANEWQFSVGNPTITGSATASAFTTTYGNASAVQSFNVSGAFLSANLIATAPTGFEVSNDGISYGSTAIFTQSSGSASGQLRVRLAATATVTGSYNSQNIVLSSSGVTSVNIVTSSTGNAVSKATPTITSIPSASQITYGQSLSNSTLSGGVASVPGTFAFTTPATAPNAGTASQDVTFTPTDADNYNSQTTSVNVTVAKATPTIVTPPTASSIVSGQSLASSSLTGGVASVAGTFAFTTPTSVPAAGTNNQSVTFTPNDTSNYETVTTSVPVQVIPAAVPSVSSAPLINGGAVQRSQLTSIVLSFNVPVTLETGAVQIGNVGLYTNQTAVILDPSQIVLTNNGSTSITVTFNTLATVGAGVVSGGVVKRTTGGNSLADGTYVLLLDKTKAKNIDGTQMASDYTFGTQQAQKLYRMFGDSDGDGVVGPADLAELRRATNASFYNSALDWDGNGSVSTAIGATGDYSNFVSNYGKRRRVF